VGERSDQDCVLSHAVGLAAGPGRGEGRDCLAPAAGGQAGAGEFGQSGGNSSSGQKASIAGGAIGNAPFISAQCSAR
jgi:hypothetical protein